MAKILQPNFKKIMKSLLAEKMSYFLSKFFFLKVDAIFFCIGEKCRLKFSNRYFFSLGLDLVNDSYPS